MSLVQIPSPELAESLGVTGYLLVVVVLAGVGTMTWFLRRVAFALDRLADGQPTVIALLTTLVERASVHDDKIDRAIALAQEHVEAARLWKATEFPGRTGRERGRDGAP